MLVFPKSLLQRSISNLSLIECCLRLVSQGMELWSVRQDRERNGGRESSVAAVVAAALARRLDRRSATFGTTILAHFKL